MKKNVPKIRFPEFIEEWELYKLGDLINELKSGLSRELNVQDIGMPVVRANNINDNHLDLNKDIKYWYVNDPQGTDTSNYIIRKGDILINFINSEAKMGTVAIVENEPSRPTIYTTNILRMRTSDLLYPYFFVAITNLQNYKYYIKAITKPAVNQASFTSVDYKNYELYIPNRLEQIKVANVFYKLDKLIAIHKRKCNEINNLKKSMLQKMFPKEGEQIPEIRFPGFKGLWEKHRLGDCCRIFAGGTPSTTKLEYWENGSINWLPSGLIQDCFIYEKDINIKITKKGLDNSSSKIIKKNTALLAMTGATCGKSGYLTCESSANQSVMAFETDELDSKFLFYTFQKNKESILKYQAGGAQAGINKEICQNLAFLFPSKKEQQKISDFFNGIDNLLIFQQEKIKTIQELKKSLLQQMFV